MPDDSALLFMFTEVLKPDVQIYILLSRSNILVEAEQIGKCADMAIFSARQCSGPP